MGGTGLVGGGLGWLGGDWVGCGIELNWLWINPLVLFIGVVYFGLVPTSV
nr:hypothetical protein Q903MT_gene967 [Picea sitchensis]